MNARRLLFLVLALFAAGACACGLPYNSVQPVPNQLLNGVPNLAPPPAGSPSTNRPFLVYFLLDGKLQAVQRPDPSASRPATPAEAIEALNNGPDAAEIRKGFSTALSVAPGAGVSYIGFASGTASVQLDDTFITSLLGVPLYEAFGQIVATLVGLDSGAVHAVEFTHDGITWPALLPNGETVYRPVALCDYAAITLSGHLACSAVAS